MKAADTFDQKENTKETSSYFVKEIKMYLLLSL
jgi:hypothetical protein